MRSETEILAAAKSVLENADTCVEDRRRYMLNFEEAVLDSSSPDDPQLIHALSPMFAQLNGLYERFETDLEEEFSRKLLAGEADVEEYPLYDRFTTLISNEVRIAKLNSGDTIAFIGSGPFPVSAIQLCNEFGIRVVAMERNHEAATLSRQIIKALGLDHDIVVQCCEGEHLIANEVSCAIVALLAQPKDAILKNIFKNYAQCTSVICRTSHGIRQALYRPTDPPALESYKIITTQFATGDQTISSILLSPSPVKSPSRCLVEFIPPSTSQ